MNSSRLRKVLTLALVVALLTGASFTQRALNRDRDRLELTRVAPLQNAPPLLALTTVALGGFRGLVVNALWMRLDDLQQADKYFEMVQLADWITKLQPHYPHVWAVQAWNMAYNISVKFTDARARWRWVQRGIELLRDEGLPNNLNEVLLYRELSWFFQHKLGQNLDDAHMLYKAEWARLMAQVFDLSTNRPFAPLTPNFDELINPQTDDARRRADLLRNTFKMDPALMKELHERHGPLEWRLPEAHAIYWASLGLERARQHPTRFKPDDLIMLRRAVYQSMLLSFHRGRLLEIRSLRGMDLAPNLAIIPKVHAAYLQAAEEDVKMRDHILKAHRNFLKDAVYFLYEYNRKAEAAYWYAELGRRYPANNVLDGRPDATPAKVPYDEYCLYRALEDASETSRDRVRAQIGGLIGHACDAYLTDDDERAVGYRLLARQVRNHYVSKTTDSGERLAVPTMEEVEENLIGLYLHPKSGWPEEARNLLITKFELTPDRVARILTNLPPVAPDTNAPAGQSPSPK